MLPLFISCFACDSNHCFVFIQACLSMLEPGMRDSLNDTMKTLKKAASAAETGDDDIDETLLT